MRTWSAFVLVAAALINAVRVEAQSTILLSDSFDSYADSNALSNVWTEVLVTKVTGTLTNTTNVTAPNSVSYDATGNQRNGRSFVETGLPATTNVITFSFDFYDSNAGAAPYRQYANLQDGAIPGSGGLVAMGLNNNQTSAENGGNYYMGRILGYTPSDTGGSSGSFFKLNDASAPLRSTGWHNLKVIFTHAEFKFYVDNILSKTVTNTVTLRSYDVVRLGSGLTSTTIANFDNVLVSLSGALNYRLALRVLPNNKFTVSWPTNAAGFFLEAKTNLNTSNWLAVTNVPVEANGTNTITNSITVSASFYRLRKIE